MLTLNVGEDTLIRWDEMAYSGNGTYVTGATGNMTVYEQIALDGSMTASDATLTSATAAFVSGDVGRSIIVHGAGANGKAHRTTIASFTSATSVELTAAAAVSVSNAVIDMSLDNAVGLSIAYVTTNGRYHGVVPSTVPLVDQAYYWIEIAAAEGSNDGFRRIACIAEYDAQSC